MSEAHGIDPRLQGIAPSQRPTKIGPTQHEGRRFEELLEELERARIHGESTPEPAKAESSLDASRLASDAAARARDELAAIDRDVATADDVHRDMLELKQRLEGAFRQRLGS